MKGKNYVILRDGPNEKTGQLFDYDDYIKFGGLKGAKENGKIRQEGKEYLIKDGDVVHFLFNI